MTTKNIIKSGTQSADDPMEFILSNETKDRDGDIIKAEGWDLKEFRKNPIALFGHNHSNPIGTWENVRVEGKSLVGRLKMAKAGTSQIVDEVRSLIEQRILRTISVGFRATEYEPLDKENPWGGLKFLKQNLLEASVVSVPSNPDAVSLAKSLGISEETRKLVFGSSTVSGGKSKTFSRGVKAVPTNKRKKGSPMKLGEKIISAQERIEELRGQVEDIVKSAEDSGRDLSEEETTQLEVLEDEIAAAEKALSGLKSAEKALAGRAKKRETERTNANVIAAVPAKHEDPMDLLWKMAHVQLRAHREKRSIQDVVEERYGHDPRVAAVAPVLSANKSAVNVAMTTVSGWAQELTDTALAGFINVLEPVSIYGRLANAGTAIPFGGENAVTVPRRNGIGTVPGSFVGEANSIPVKNDDYGSTTLNRYKAAVITPFSNELSRVSNPAIEGLLRDAIVTDTGVMLDSVVMDPAMTAIAGIRPASPFVGAPNQASTGNTLENILADLRFLMDTLSNANAGRNPYLIINPGRLSGLSMLTNANGSFVFRDEIAQGRLMGIPLIASTNCPADHVFIIDAADFATAFGAPEFDVSEQATLVMANDDGTNPTMAATNAVSDAGSLHVSDAAGTTPPTVVRSMFQTWSTALRMVMPISWGTTRDGTRAYITGVSW